ncbi:hypothetical protein OC845_005106 [Tilletia horrida]|nr:hypothetical protein OC845_005106 [Tilletia horrida]
MPAIRRSKAGGVKKEPKLSVKKERVHVKKEAVGVKKEEAVSSGSTLVGPSSSPSGSSSTASSPLKRADAKLEEDDEDEDVKIMVKKDESDDSDDDRGGDEELILPDEDEAALPTHLQHLFFSFGSDAFLWPIPECILCKTDRNIKQRIVGVKADGELLTLWFCRDHDPLRSMHKSAAIKHYRRYKAQGGNLTNDDLLKAEQQRLIEVRYRANPHTRNGLPQMRLYYVEDLERLRLAKQDFKANQEREKQERKAAEKRQKEEERAAKKAETQRVREQKKKERAQAARARRAAARNAGAAPVAADEAAAMDENVAGPSGTATVQSFPYYSIDDGDDGGALGASSDLPYQNAPLGADFFPGSSVFVTSTFVEPPEEVDDAEDAQQIRPGVMIRNDPVDATTSAQTSAACTIKQERT